jgi:hypothetical protein
MAGAALFDEKLCGVCVFFVSVLLSHSEFFVWHLVCGWEVFVHVEGWD